MENWHINPYSLALFAAAIFAFYISWELWKRRMAVGAGHLSIFMLAAGYWAAAYGMELSSQTLALKLFWAYAAALVIPFLPVLALVMILYSLGKKHWLTRRRLALLFAGPVAAVLLYWTNPWHGWVSRNVHLITTGGIVTLKADQQWFYWLYTVYSYLLLAVGMGVMAHAYRTQPLHKQQQIRLASLGIVLVGSINLFALLDLPGVPELDWTPFSFIVLGAFAAWGLFHWRLFPMPSISRETFEPLFSPHVSLLLEEDHQRARALAVVSLVVFVLFVGAAAYQVMNLGRYFFLGGLALLLAYALSRSRYYKWGVWLLLATMAWVPIVAVMNMPGGRPGDIFRTLLWELPAVILAGWLLCAAEVWLLALGQAALLWWASHHWFSLHEKSLMTIYALLFVFAILSSVLTWLRERDAQTLRKATVDLARSQKYLTNVINSLDSPFYVINVADYSIELANEAARALGIARNSTCYALTHQRETPCAGDEHPCPLVRVRECKQPYTVEHIHYRPDGSAYHAEVHGYPILDEAGNVVQMIEYSLDITARKQAEAEIRKLTRSIEESASSVVITNAEGTIEYVNPAFERISGYSAADALGQNPRILKSGQMPPDFYEKMWETLSRGQVWRGEIINRKKDGSLYWEFTTISPVLDEQGRITHFVSIKEDITERKRIEEALAQERQKTDALLHNILPAEVVAEIKEKGQATPSLIENASVLFADFVDFTNTAEQLSPQELVDMLDVYFSAFDAIMEKHGLEKLKTIGDSYMCAAGLPTPSETHAVDITRAAFDMLAFVEQEKARRREQGQPAWEIRIGISSGPLVAGVVGRKKYAYDVWGDTVVMAARMEETSAPGHINISQSTYDLIHDRFICQYRGRIAAKHKGQVNMYFVLRPR